VEKLYKHIIWDFDGTLFDSYPVLGIAFKKTLEEEGITESSDEILKYMKVSKFVAIQHYKNKYNISNAFVDRFEKNCDDIEIGLCKPYKGIEDICRYIYTHGKHNYLFTHRGESAVFFLTKYNMYDYFTECVTSKNEFKRKPSPDAINYLVEKYNIIRSEAIMIGDRDIDILSAKNAGINSCYYNDNGNKSNIANYTINSPDQLYTII
jgi:HAD superfamily hydrolase (TIGR01509 family)